MYFARLFCSRAEPRVSIARATAPLFLQTCLALALTGCSFHAHSEFHTGKGGDSSAGAENEAASHEQTGSTQHEGRHSHAGRDKVVRVTSSGSSKPAVEQGGGADEPARTAVHPTGDVPASSGGASAAAGGNDGAASEPAVPPKQAASTPVVEPPASPAADAPAAGEDTPSTGKGSLKSPSEPHVAVPTQKPRKVHRNGGTSKDGRRE